MEGGSRSQTKAEEPKTWTMYSKEEKKRYNCINLKEHFDKMKGNLRKSGDIAERAEVWGEEEGDLEREGGEGGRDLHQLARLVAHLRL